MITRTSVLHPRHKMRQLNGRTLFIRSWLTNRRHFIEMSTFWPAGVNVVIHLKAGGLEVDRTAPIPPSGIQGRQNGLPLEIDGVKVHTLYVSLQPVSPIRSPAAVSTNRPTNLERRYASVVSLLCRPVARRRKDGL